ncbi:MAG: hypothetical protein ACRC8P_03130 [Spiroplasma sp.]
MKYIEHLFINFIFQNKNNNFSVFYSTLKEEIIKLKKKYQLDIKTIYIATNDLLYSTDQQLISFLTLISDFVSKNLIEYSFEIGYFTLSKNQLAILKKFKVNRLVWKVRTFNNKLLLNLNQQFNSESLMKLFKISQNFEFKNFSIDLEDNIHSQTKINIIADLQIALKLNAPHISYQSNNNFHNQKNKKLINHFLKQHSYQNYEFFSFAVKRKFYSHQTLGYLNLKNWYGLGPNGSSFLKNNDKKIIISNTNKIPWNTKIVELDQKMYYQLLIFQGLMLQKGILLQQDYLAAFKHFYPSIIKLIDSKYLQLKNNYLKVTIKGWNLLNQILVDIII